MEKTENLAFWFIERQFAGCRVERGETNCFLSETEAMVFMYSTIIGKHGIIKALQEFLVKGLF